MILHLLQRIKRIHGHKWFSDKRTEKTCHENDKRNSYQDFGKFFVVAFVSKERSGYGDHNIDETEIHFLNIESWAEKICKESHGNARHVAAEYRNKYRPQGVQLKRQIQFLRDNVTGYVNDYSRRADGHYLERYNVKLEHEPLAFQNFCADYIMKNFPWTATGIAKNLRGRYPSRSKTPPFRAGDISRKNLAKISFESYNVKKTMRGEK